MVAMNIVLDTCVLINLCAACDLGHFVDGTGIVLHVPSAVAEETLRLYVGRECGQSDPEEVELQRYFDAGVLIPCQLQSGQETELYVQLARHLDDGEAMALAMAKARDGLLASDDRKARRRAELLGLDVATTPELMIQWAKATSASHAAIARALINIQEIARFRPSQDSPHFEWWTAAQAE
jgi:predicted nucleic acid-binding protein